MYYIVFTRWKLLTNINVSYKYEFYVFFFFIVSKIVSKIKFIIRRKIYSFVGTNVKEGSISRNDIIFTYFYIFPAYFHPFFSLLKKEKIVIQNVKKWKNLVKMLGREIDGTIFIYLCKMDYFNRFSLQRNIGF